MVGFQLRVSRDEVGNMALEGLPILVSESKE